MAAEKGRMQRRKRAVGNMGRREDSMVVGRVYCHTWRVAPLDSSLDSVQTPDRTVSGTKAHLHPNKNRRQRHEVPTGTEEKGSVFTELNNNSLRVPQLNPHTLFPDTTGPRLSRMSSTKTSAY